MKKNLLYIGNKLVSAKTNITTIDTLGNLLKDEGYQVKFSSSKQNRVIRLLDMVFSVIKNRKSTDYVLIDTYSTQNFYYALAVSQICRFFRIKYIPILHGGNLPMRLKKSPRKSKLIFNNSFINVSPSHYIKEKFNELGFTNIEYIPNTIEINNYPFKERKEVKAKLLWVRSFKKIYNPLMAIKVVEQLQKEGVSTKLTMVGPDGDGTLLLANKLARESDLDIEFTGKLTRQEWIGISQDHDIFINTSYFDNMPVSLIEAMALGLPVVTTNVGGIPSLAKNDYDALLIAPDDIQAMVTAIKSLINNSVKANSLAENGRKSAEKFDWSAVKLKWKNLLK